MNRLITWQLWQRIHIPPHEHVLYRRGYEGESGRRSLLIRLVLGVITLIGGTPIVMFFFPLVPFLLMLANTLNGISLASAASVTIAQEKERQTYDLLTVIPEGALSAVWLLMLGALHRTHAYDNLRLWRVWIPRLVPVSLIIFSVMTIMTALDSGTVKLGITIANGLYFLIAVPLVVAIVLNTDNIHSIIIAALIGMLTASYVNDRDNARTIAVTGFVALQFVTYALYVLLLYIPLNVLANATADTYFVYWGLVLAGGIVYLMVTVIAIVGTRELMTRILWRLLQRYIVE